MNYHYLNFRLLILVIISTLFFISCTTNPEMQKSSGLKSIQLESNFNLEGKFKASVADIKESGYFVFKKTGNTIELRIGKNFLLPEKEMNFFLNETINLDDLFTDTDSSYKYNLNGKAILLKDLLKILIGQKEVLTSGWIINYPEGFSSVSNYNLPKRIILENNEVKLEIINKKYFE